MATEFSWLTNKIWFKESYRHDLMGRRIYFLPPKIAFHWLEQSRKNPYILIVLHILK